MPTVLIVDDCENTAVPLEIALAAIRGVHVMHVSSARAAFELFNSGRERIAALVTDLHLPHMDGFQLVEEVRKDKRYSALPIVVVSGDSHPDTPARLLRLGVNAYFPKPYSPSEIRSKLEALLDAHSIALGDDVSGY